LLSAGRPVRSGFFFVLIFFGRSRMPRLTHSASHLIVYTTQHHCQFCEE
jgi:hypothetical protein